MYIKNWNQFNENIINRFGNFTKFEDLEVDDYFRLYYDNEFTGYYRVVDKYSADSTTVGADSLNVQKYNEDGTFNPGQGNFVIPIDDNRYQFEKLEKVSTSGIVFVYNQKILLVHPTNHTRQQYSYPKGQLEVNEDLKEGAIREVREEIGVEYDINQLNTEPGSIRLLRQKNFKTYYYYIVYLNPEQFKKYFNTLIIPKKNLQLEEIDWAGFVDIEDCADMLDPKFHQILKHFQ